jgi:hypothetical protein
MKTTRSSIRGFQDQLYEDSFFQSNKSSVFEHIAPIYFPIYSVVLVLHTCVNECANMIGLTRRALSFLKISESLGSRHRLRIV